MKQYQNQNGKFWLYPAKSERASCQSSTAVWSSPDESSWTVCWFRCWGGGNTEIGTTEIGWGRGGGGGGVAVLSPPLGPLGRIDYLQPELSHLHNHSWRSQRCLLLISLVKQHNQVCRHRSNYCSAREAQCSPDPWSSVVLQQGSRASINHLLLISVHWKKVSSLEIGHEYKAELVQARKLGWKLVLRGISTILVSSQLQIFNWFVDLNAECKRFRIIIYLQLAGGGYQRVGNIRMFPTRFSSWSFQSAWLKRLFPLLCITTPPQRLRTPERACCQDQLSST